MVRSAPFGSAVRLARVAGGRRAADRVHRWERRRRRRGGRPGRHAVDPGDVRAPSHRRHRSPSRRCPARTTPRSSRSSPTTRSPPSSSPRPTRRYVDCLVEGGAVGRYAYGIELHTGLVVEWVEVGESTRRRTQRAQRRLLTPPSRRPDEQVRTGQPAGRRPRRTPQRQHRHVHRTDQPGGRRQPSGGGAVGTTGETTPSASCSSTRQPSTPHRSGRRRRTRLRSARASPRSGTEWRAFG